MSTRDETGREQHLAAVETSLGRFVLTASARGLVAVAPAGEAGGVADSCPPPPEPGTLLAAAAAWLLAYAAGDPRPFEGAIDPRGTEFERRVWAWLQAIPFGTCRSYGAIASELGAGVAARAVGAAVAANALALVIPCHRVVGARGELTGYAWGTDFKRRLLAHEARHVPFALTQSEARFEPDARRS